MPTRPRPASTLAPRLVLAGARACLTLAGARAWLALAGALALCAGPRAARADEAAAGGGQARNDWHLEAGVGTDFPVQLGARVGL
ncbi:MAG TPA: hypothetical protein VFS00_26200, partial [Polyangiaceae bacterium]|nr:hypothetical protein [Polyangiaceae bacterium]